MSPIDARALIVVDLQNDFVTGSLAVPGAHEILVPIKKLIKSYNVVIFSRDWHPPDHISFKDHPVHCVEGTWGAELAIEPLSDHIIINKGTQFDVEEYSAYLKAKSYLTENISEIHIVGLALDYCVKATALDAIRDHKCVYVLEDLCRSLRSSETVDELKAAGVYVRKCRQLCEA